MVQSGDDNPIVLIINEAIYPERTIIQFEIATIFMKVYSKIVSIGNTTKSFQLFFEAQHIFRTVATRTITETQTPK